MASQGTSTNKRRQIFYAWNYREWGGAQIYFMSLMKEAKKSYSITALLPLNSEQKLLNYLALIDVPVSFLPPVEALPPANGLFAKIRRSLTHLSSENLLVREILRLDGLSEKIVHIDLGFWQSLTTLIRLSRKTNVFTTVHTGLRLFTGLRGLRWKIKGKLISRFSRFHLLASNADARESLRPYITAKKFDQVEIAYSGFDPAEIDRVIVGRPSIETARERWRLPEEGTVMMSVGQFIERKGCWVLLESLRRLKRDGLSFTFLWLSTIPPDTETAKRIEDYGLGGSFRVLAGDEIGETRDDLLMLMSFAGIFVLASLQEGLPIALVEAMALGLPCIATGVNAVPEAIKAGENGILIPPGDPAKLAEAILGLMNDAQKRKLLGTAAKRVAYSRFNEQITAYRTIKLYDAVWKTDS